MKIPSLFHSFQPTCAAITVLLASLACSPAQSPMGAPSFARQQACYADNIALRTDLSGNDLKTKNELSFRVFVISTLTAPLQGLSLKVWSDQFDATIAPSPEWKTFPELPKATGSGTKVYFTVTLKKKSTKPLQAIDLVLKLFASDSGGQQLIAFQPLSEMLETHEIPFQSSFAFDGTTHPKKWGNSFALHDLTTYTKEADGNFYRSGRSRTRVQWVADKEYLFFLVTFFQVGAGGVIEIMTAPSLDAQPLSLTLNRADGTVKTSLPNGSFEFKKCMDDPLMILDPKDPFQGPPADTFEGRVSLKALGITPGQTFYANAIYNRLYCWCGNLVSSRNPIMFAHMIIPCAR